MLSFIRVAMAALAILALTSTTSAQNPPWVDIGLTLDVSGSINDPSLQLEIDGLKACIAQLPQNGDVAIAIAVYATTGAGVLALTPVTAATLPTIDAALDGLLLDRIVDTNSTNIAAGIEASLAQLALGDGPTQAMLLVGDGAANVGDTAAACAAAGSAGVEICAIAIGADTAGQAELEACAQATGGAFGLAATFEDFGAICEECFDDIVRANVECSPTQPGSVLLYPVHTSGDTAFTIINVTNTNLTPANPISLGGSTNVKFEWVNVVRNPDNRFEPNGCVVFDKVEVLTPADTLSVLSRCHNADGLLPPFNDNDPQPGGIGSEGYVVITAFDPASVYRPWAHNHLIGSELVLMANGLSYSLNAISFQALQFPGGSTDIDQDGRRDFDDVEYCPVADQMYIDSFLGVSESYLACVNLTGHWSDTNTLHFSIWNDNERPMSITRPFKCWFNQRLARVSNLFSYAYLSFTDNDPRELDVTCDRNGDLETGWAIIDSIGVRTVGGTPISSDGAFVGCVSAGYESVLSGGRLLWESSAKQTNGSFGP